MTTEVKRLIRVRTDKGARFKRDGYGKKRQLSDSWRKPRGQHNKQREQKKAKGAHPKPGFGSPVAVRGMHPSGFFEVLVTTLKDLTGLDPKTQAVRIGATVGIRKRATLQEQAISQGLKVLNAHIVKTPKVKPGKAKPVKKSKGDEEKAGKKSGVKSATAAPARKEAKKTAAKPAAGKAEEKTEKKAATKAPAKKAAAKPADEKSSEAKPRAAAKPRAKTTRTGVKKDE